MLLSYLVKLELFRGYGVCCMTLDFRDASISVSEHGVCNVISILLALPIIMI